ncbi:MAG: hypothetical protein A3J07_01045 [Candidatus Doudnabacteria bacterium RIFCSPLOWO2_02_FULL_49_13]|uniref:Uncharacterized protein n=1 Tax=Candidatus Doudnabacteria bacterium RIFCSPHIGHO2_12_FULL_48_16 TaxID=1817838 RepID=A0A1F5PKV6_9BACT|nr:MAG: hypothetical protein A3B77_03975 [Candidatus Doudnabacteria bacterium RIFCSPHIGHO2_02_FULL_49_24]OGE88645.1 MAG: hypothetical protein A2760_01635 [Candidatus Doudnabacteria bacterium RIFCSPHIGHO2_01_FULL_50_67]OGE90330.1 MAG: hypothetical protein A3E29_04555 [Candidatus Doudnabacteria bacterium RIFCSPHIGHO2_12_FULL_48_16]OGE97037.1 MAG: hypothetical protein A2990_01545 [Candidatus Doudnabacteria bacterium RIFCSPLOWO2_01_FULL_49_40]OGF02386.1 MAG: hypothetical protein A3J07_01045 [Candid
MADEQEQQQAKDRHYETMGRLETLRSDVYNEIRAIINRYYERVPADNIYEREERGFIRDELRRVQTRIDETINGL